MSRPTIFCRFCGTAGTRRFGSDARGRRRFHCTACGRTFARRTNTAKSGSRLSAREWELAARIFASRGGMSGADLARTLGYGPRTGRRLNRAFRRAAQRLIPSRLSGWTEWDEATTSGQWVLGGVSRDTRQCLLRCIPDRTERTLVPAVEGATTRESFHVTDEWGGYLRLVNHLTVCHQHGFVAEYCRAVHTNTQEGIWGHLKPLAWHVYRGFRKRTLPEFLAEVMFRYNIRCYRLRLSVLSALLSRPKINTLVS